MSTLHDALGSIELDGALDLASLRLAHILDAMSEGLVIQRASGEIAAANSSALRILGLTREQLYSRTSFDPRWRAVHEDGSEFRGEAHPAMVSLRTGQPVHDVLMGVHKPDGTLTWVAIHAYPVFESGARTPTSVVATFRDVTELRQAQLASLRRDAVLRVALEGWPAALVVFDAEQLTAYELNTRFGQLLALDAAQCAQQRGAPLTGILARLPLSAEDHRTLESLARGAGPAQRVTLADGRVLECSAFGVSPSGAAVASRVLVLDDITTRARGEDERRTLERRMRELERFESLGALAGGIAHEFNNLLTGILGSTELVLGGLAPADPARRQLDRVVEASLRATALCAEMIASAGPGAVEVRRLHLSDVVHRALRLLQPSTSTRVRIEERFERELPWVLADEAQLKRVFENLFLNACEAVEAKGGLVRVTTGAARFEARDFDAMVFAPRLPAGEYVWFEVEDDGVGMDALTQSRMFDPFFSTKFAGRGLGLSSSASIVRSHNGAIEVASQPGVGTRLRVLLPKAL